MSQYDLRSAFPLNGKDFVVEKQRWICHLAEVSDQRPSVDRLSWYLVFEPDSTPGGTAGKGDIRKLEIVTSATRLLQAGWGNDLAERLIEWLLSGEQDGRQEWLDK